MSQYANFLKLGMTKLVLDAIEADVDFTDLTLADPVAEIKAVSHDPSCTHELTLADGRRLSAIDILRIYRERVRGEDDVDKRVLELWGELLDDLERDPMSTADRLDWTAKWALVRAYLARGIDIADPKLKAIDLQYSDIDPRTSLHHALVRKGRMRTLVDAEVIATAAQQPPADSRAFFRGAVSTKFGDNILASNWQAVVFNTVAGPYKIRLDDVDTFTRAEVGDLIERADTVEALIASLGATGDKL